MLAEYYFNIKVSFKSKKSKTMEIMVYGLNEEDAKNRAMEDMYRRFPSAASLLFQ